VTGGEETIDALARTLDALDEHLRDSDAVVRRSERNRLSLLHVHALAAVVIAPLFALLGRDGMAGPSWAVARFIPGAPYTLAVLLGIGGVILGVATWYRRVGWELVGLWVLMCWYATIAASFAGAVLVWFAEGRPPQRPSFYAAAVYAHIGIVLWVHRMTLAKIRRGRRRAAR
jgi:hypothetical protein